MSWDAFPNHRELVPEPAGLPAYSAVCNRPKPGACREFSGGRPRSLLSFPSVCGPAAWCRSMDRRLCELIEEGYPVTLQAMQGLSAYRHWHIRRYVASLFERTTECAAPANGENPVLEAH